MTDSNSISWPPFVDETLDWGSLEDAQARDGAELVAEIETATREPKLSKTDPPVWMKHIPGLLGQSPELRQLRVYLMVHLEAVNTTNHPNDGDKSQKVYSGDPTPAGNLLDAGLIMVEWSLRRQFKTLYRRLNRQWIPKGFHKEATEFVKLTHPGVVAELRGEP